MTGLGPTTHDLTRDQLVERRFPQTHGDIRTAIQRETSLKRWPRARKVRLIIAGNPKWDDLSVGLM
jgi:predicted GIY-YIG superfamily endonuclease